MSCLSSSFLLIMPIIIYASLFALKAAKADFEKLLGRQVFENHNCNPFHTSFTSLPIDAAISICCVNYFIPSFNVLSGYFNVSLNLVAVPTL